MILVYLTSICHGKPDATGQKHIAVAANIMDSYHHDAVQYSDGYYADDYRAKLEALQNVLERNDYFSNDDDVTIITGNSVMKADWDSLVCKETVTSLDPQTEAIWLDIIDKVKIRRPNLMSVIERGSLLDTYKARLKEHIFSQRKAQK